MNARRPARSPLAGGSLLAMSLLAGVVIGTAMGEPSLGFLVGLATGIALVALVWLLDQRRKG